MRRKYVDNIYMNIKTNRTCVNWNNLAQDSVHWRGDDYLVPKKKGGEFFLLAEQLSDYQ
jgi:hypothetical protein